jgi:CheY-like chemotaxis protein
MKKILIVEDDAVTAFAHRRCLERAGFAVHVVSDAQAALDCISKVAPDAFLLDLVMPRMNGIRFLKTLRALPDWAKAPVFVYTNVFTPTRAQEAQDAGATKVFEKGTLTVEMLTTAFLGALESPDQEIGQDDANR